MIQYPPPTARPARLGASIIFGLTLAVLAGLIGAYAFRTYVMNGKPVLHPTVLHFVFHEGLLRGSQLCPAW